MPQQVSKYIYGMSNFVYYMAIIFLGLLTYGCWYGAYEFLSDFNSAIQETSLTNLVIGTSAFFASTILFLFYIVGRARGGFQKVEITLEEDKIIIPNWGWNQKRLEANYSDIKKTRWVPVRYGSLFEIKFKNGRRATFMSLLFSSLSEFQQFKTLVRKKYGK